MKTVKILGGGISGLTAAINLKYAGVNVEVHERKGFCGKSSCDFQILENWTLEKDALEILQNFHIRPDFYVKSSYAMEFRSPSLTRCLKRSADPLMYILKRGPMEGALDQALQKQAIGAHIPIIFNSKLPADDADIIAIGKHNPSFVVNGATFALDRPDKVVTLFDDRLSYKAYAYFIVNDQVGQIVAINPTQRKDHIARFEATVKRFEEMYRFKVGAFNHRFAATGSLNYLKNAKINGRYLVGEAAGFQDCLTGFGMMYAFKSGFHAAQSIIHSDDYNHRWQTDMLETMDVSRTNRCLFERLSNDGYEKLVRLLASQNPVIVKLLGGDDLKDILTKLYNHSFSHLLLPLLFWRRWAPLYQFLLKLMGRIFSR